MAHTVTGTNTYSYTVTDIETVVRRFTADIVMISQSSGAITEAEARDYAHDIEALANEGYLKEVDLTLFNGGTEIRAIQYVVCDSAGNLTMSRPGGVMWPRVTVPNLRVVIGYTNLYDATARERMQRKLRISWIPTNADTSHSGLIRGGERSYVSNGWAMQRRDYGV